MSANQWGIRPEKEIIGEVNYEEKNVPRGDIPPVLLKNDGSTVKSSWEWMNFRRQEILQLYRREVFGEFPPRPDRVTREVVSVKDGALDGTAVRKEIKITFGMDNGSVRSFVMLFYLPKSASSEAPAPVVVELNFRGNHAASPEADCMETGYDAEGRLIEKVRHAKQSRFPAKKIISRGFAVATACYCDIFPDFYVDFALSDGKCEQKAWERSIYGMFFPGAKAEELSKRYSAIGAWSWGLSRMLDALEGEEAVDCRRAMVVGHSRLGKTALWAGACDERFKVVVSNDSGHGGAALFRRCLGESIELLIAHFPHWFVENFRKYARKDGELPFDQHFLMSLIAPRGLCIGSATEDLWADPKGEFLAGLHASPVWDLFGAEGMPSAVQPAPDRNLTGEISYHLRTGKHDITAQDWEHYLEVAEKFLLKR